MLCTFDEVLKSNAVIYIAYNVYNNYPASNFYNECRNRLRLEYIIVWLDEITCVED